MDVPDEEREMSVEEVRRCLVCDAEGTVLYEQLDDRLFGVVGIWNLWECPRCGLIWLNPCPTVEDIPRAYAAGYFTHGETRQSESSDSPFSPLVLLRGMLASTYRYSLRNHGTDGIGPLLENLPIARDFVGAKFHFHSHTPLGKLLEVGCGNGSFLARMKSLGWDVYGVEPDPVASQRAQQSYNLPIFRGTLEEANLPPKSFDAISLAHVIEHIHDPVSLLTECHRLLKPNGRVTILTPNAKSLGHWLFGRRWLGLDPPRHLHVFTCQTLSAIVRKTPLSVRTVRTLSRWALTVWLQTRSNKDASRLAPRKVPGIHQLEAFSFLLFEECLRYVNRNLGEEILLVAGA